MITKESLIQDLRDLGVREGDILNVKMSYKSIGKIEGGINTTIEALLEAVGSEGTIVSDSFVLSHFPIEMLLRPKKCLVDQETKSYAGALANVLVKYPGAMRSPHPIQKFVALGKRADIVMKHNVNSAPYSTLHSIAKMGAKNLRIGSLEKVVGVGTTHVAVDILGWKQKTYRTGVNYIDNGKLKKFYHYWPESCKVAFNNLIPLYKKYGGIISEGRFGNADAILSDMGATLALELNIGSQFPYFLKCQDPGCPVCRLQWKDSTGSVIKVFYHNLRRRNFKTCLKVILWYILKKETK